MSSGIPGRRLARASALLLAGLLPGPLAGETAVFVDGFEQGSAANWTDVVGGEPLAGFGALAGDCGSLHPATLDSPSPGLFEARIDFGSDPYDGADYEQLTPGGRSILDEAGSGSSSVLRRVFGFEALARCELASLLKTTSQIAYEDEGGERADFKIEVDGIGIGVTMAAAYVYPPGTPYPLAVATTMLVGKLGDVLESSDNVTPADAWRKQVLVVLTDSGDRATVVATAWGEIEHSLRADTVVLVLTTDGDDSWIW